MVLNVLSKCFSSSGAGGLEIVHTLLDLCVSSFRRDHGNILCIAPMLTDDPRRACSIEINNSILFASVLVFHWFWHFSVAIELSAPLRR